MKRLITLLSVFGCMLSLQADSSLNISVETLKTHVSILASDSLKGRYPGAPEDSVLGAFLIDAYQKAGAALMGEKGYQFFDVVVSVEAGENNRLSVQNHSFQTGQDFTPMPFSGNGQVQSDVVFAGYGFDFKTDSLTWNDYEGIDVQDKWVMLLRSNPEPDSLKSVYVNFSEDRDKVLTASDHGAAGVLLVNGPAFDGEDQLMSLKSRAHQTAVPVLHLKRNVADQLLETASVSIQELDSLLQHNRQPHSFCLEIEVNASAEIQPTLVQTFNTMALLLGSDPELKEEYIVIGAHHDHLGMGGPSTSSRARDTLAVHYGADDNASGTAGVLALADLLTKHSPKRSVLFCTFGAEEMGILGSRYLTEHPPVPLNQMQAMVNMDMLGRLSADSLLQIGGVGTSARFQPLLEEVNKQYALNLKFSREGYGPSDHASFYAKDVPVLFFSTGAHADYHTPEDKVTKINFEGQRLALTYIADVVLHLANQDSCVLFQDAGPKIRASSHRNLGKVRFGLMPDVTYDGKDGMPVMFVTEGRPAAVGGMQKGDVITAIDGKTVGNVYDYMHRLRQLKTGQVVVVSIRRGDDSMNLLLQL